MTIKTDHVQKLVNEHNYQGLANYLQENANDVETILPSNTFTLAVNLFIQSDAHSMTNSYKIIELLQQHFFDENRRAKYELPQKHQNIFSLFSIFNKISQHQTYTVDDVNAITGIEGIYVPDLQSKLALYEERQQHRNLYKITDELIEKQLIYPIKYPENTSFIRKLLGIRPKRSAEDIAGDFASNLPGFIETLKNNLQQDPKFCDSNGNFLLTDAELSSLIYERISIKASKQLKIEHKTLEKTFRQYNTSQLETVLAEISNAEPEKFGKLQEDFIKILNTSIPEYLIDFTQLSFNFPYINPDNEQDTRSLENMKDGIKKALQGYISNLIDQIELQNGVSRKNTQTESMIRSLLVLNKYCQENEFVAECEISGQEVTKFTIILNNIQKELNDKAYADHNKISKSAKTPLTEFEKRAITVMALPTEQLTEQDKKLLATFMEYASGNKDFNTRLGKIIKSENTFVKGYLEQIKSMHKYTFKVSNLEEIKLATDKLERIMYHIENNTLSDLRPEDKLSVHEIGALKKFTDVKSQIKLMQDYGLDSISKPLQNMVNLFNRSSILYSKLEEHISKTISQESGDIVVDISQRKRSFYLNSPNLEGRIRDWLSSGYLHTSIGITEDDRKLLSHVDQPRYAREDVDVMQPIYTKTFRVSIINLLENKEVKQYLMDSYNCNESDLPNILQKEYANAARDLHNLANDQGINLEFNKQKGEKAFKADFIPGGHSAKEDVRSWAAKVLADKEQLSHSIKEGQDGKSGNAFICSEFTAKMTAITLIELEKNLFEKIRENNPDYKMPANGLLKMPFDQYEDLSKVHPGRLVQQLKKYNAIEAVTQPTLVSQIIR